jgi:hypothetical protein
MLYIDLEEEYGFRRWLWQYPGSKEQLLADWNAGKAPLNFFDPSTSKFSGDLILVKTGLFGQKSYIPYDAYAHVHWDDDTYLKLDGVRHPGVVDHTNSENSNEEPT